MKDMLLIMLKWVVCRLNVGVEKVNMTEASVIEAEKARVQDRGRESMEPGGGLLQNSNAASHAFLSIENKRFELDQVRFQDLASRSSITTAVSVALYAGLLGFLGTLGVGSLPKPQWLSVLVCLVTMIYLGRSIYYGIYAVRGVWFEGLPEGVGVFNDLIAQKLGSSQAAADFYIADELGKLNQGRAKSLDTRFGLLNRSIDALLSALFYFGFLIFLYLLAAFIGYNAVVPDKRSESEESSQQASVGPNNQASNDGQGQNSEPPKAPSDAMRDLIKPTAQPVLIVQHIKPEDLASPERARQVELSDE